MALIALDTNILVYAEGVNGEGRQHAARRVIEQLHGDDLVIPAQVLGELFTVLTRKAERALAAARLAAE